ncbi:MAG: hypothetical protein K6C36_02370 [Clostridia bacterium]|nr:hypothetical protein [Clostridia bacterium]
MNSRTTYKKEHLREISFPLGGMGSGCIGLAGNGSLVDWEIFNRPNKGGGNGYSHFALKASRAGRTIDARVLCADDDTRLTGDYSHGYGEGKRASSMQGFPHFRDCVFTGEFPVARVVFEDASFPGAVSLTAFNPLIPLNDSDSSIPAAFLEYAVTNTTGEPVDYTFAGTLMNPSEGSVNEFVKTRDGGALFLRQTKYSPDETEYCDMSLAASGVGAVPGAEGVRVSCQEYWYRGGWNDGLERYWRNFTENDCLPGRSYPDPGCRDTGTLALKLSAAPGKEASSKTTRATGNSPVKTQSLKCGKPCIEEARFPSP